MTQVEHSFVLKSTKTYLRKTKFKEFWAIPSWDANRSYLLGHVDKRKQYKRRGNYDLLKKTTAFDCYLHNLDGIKVRVCGAFFLSTLSLGRDTFTRWITSGLAIDVHNATNKKSETVLVKKK